MVADKQLIIVVEGTSTLGMYWSTILSDYLEKIVRVFCRVDSIEESHTTIGVGANFELQLVSFFTHGLYGPNRFGWTRKMDVFMDHLNSMQFVGGGFNDAATIDGLVDALMMFRIPQNGHKTEGNLVGRRHCILVAATNPYPLPLPVYRPDGCGGSSRNHDVETVAGWFGQCSVSLSVICPRKLPKIRALYELGKRNHDSEDPPVQIQHPNFLVMISEDFKDAQAALHSTVLATQQDSSPARPVSEASIAYQPVSQPASNSLALPFGNFTPTNLDMEAAAIYFSTPQFCPPAACFSEDTISMLGCQTSSPSLVSQNLIMNIEDTLHHLLDMSPSLLSKLNDAAGVLHARENVLAAFKDLASSGLLSGNYSNMMASGTSLVDPVSQTALSSEKPSNSMVSGFDALTGTSQAVTNSSVSLESATNIGSKVSSIGLSRSSSNLQGSTTGIARPTKISSNQIKAVKLEGSLSTSPNTFQNLGSIDVASSVQIPLQGLPQQSNFGEQSDGLNCSTISMPMSQETPGSVQRIRCKYDKVWEGNLLAIRERHFASVTRLEAYRKTSTPAAIVADWPDSIKIVGLMSVDRVNDMYNIRRAVLLIFKVLDEHMFFSQLRDKRLCAVIELPSQTLLVSVTDKITRLIGMLLPKDARISSASASTAAAAAAAAASQHP